MNELINLFNNEEQVILNHLAIGVSKDNFLTKLNFDIKISNDDNIVDLLKELEEKVLKVSNEKWEQLQEIIPFEVLYADEDIENSEVEMDILNVS